MSIANIKGVSVKKDDIVYIKFKELKDVIYEYEQQGHVPVCFLEDSDIDSNLSCFLQGGYFRVNSIHTNDDYREFPNYKKYHNKNNEDKPHEISIVNHLNDDYDWTFNENIVEEIRVEHDAAEYYFSTKFKASFMKLDGQLYINNKKVTKSDKKLIKMLEGVISDLAIASFLDNE